MFDGSILHDLFSGRIFCLFLILERNCNFGNGAEELCYSFNSYNSFHSLRYEITLHKSNLLFFLPFLLTTTNFLRFLIPVRSIDGEKYFFILRIHFSSEGNRTAVKIEATGTNRKLLVEIHPRDPVVPDRARARCLLLPLACNTR